MFNKKNSQPNHRELAPSKAADPTMPKYPQPKILLVDMKDETEAVLKAEGYNVFTGSFGTPYKVPKSDQLCPVIANGNLPPNFTEQEIVVIDLVPATTLNGPQGEKHTSWGEDDWWVSCNKGEIDPRPRLMDKAREAFDRIRSHGGAFVIFADHRNSQKLTWAHLEKNLLGSDIFKKGNDINRDNWCFLSLPGYLHAKPDRRQEISVVEEKSHLDRILSEHIEGAHSLCTLHPVEMKGSWITLATDKYGAPVAGAIAPTKGTGWIFILPQLHDKARFLAQFFKDVLPDLAPHLFPYLEGARWVHRPEYELPKVLELRNRIKQIQEEAKRQVAELEKAIEEECHTHGYMYDLIRATDRSLVSAVKKTLEVLGFQSVVDVDEEMKKTADTGPKREDLQIHNYSPILLVEVKGISGLPKDAAALQVQKYVAPRMREWGRTDIQGLEIINHQRNLPALDRENKAPFRQDILTNAQEQGFGLLTTWDLFRLTRSYLKNGWRHEHIKELFYQSGRIDPVPKHYEFIGVVEHFWERPGAVGVRIEAAELRQGDRIAFELPVDFEEQDVESLQVDGQPVDQAGIGMLAGIKTHLTKEQAKKRVHVFRLIEHLA